MIFPTKYFLEHVDKTTNYLIYAPFPKPDVRDNHLEDTMLYSRQFFADRVSLLSAFWQLCEQHFRNAVHFIIMCRHLFKLDWVLMSIVILCVIAMGLYALIGVVEKWYKRRM